DAQSVDRYPLPIFPIAARLRDLTDVDLRVEIGRECLAVAAGVAVDDVDRLDAIEQLLLSVGAKDVSHARVEPGAQQGHDATISEPLAICPLPLVFELCDV